MQQCAKLRNECDGIPLRNLPRHFLHPLASDKSKHLLYALRRERPLRERHALIENRERIAHPAVCLHGDDGERRLLCRDAGFFADVDEPL